MGERVGLGVGVLEGMTAWAAGTTVDDKVPPPGEGKLAPAPAVVGRKSCNQCSPFLPVPFTVEDLFPRSAKALQFSIPAMSLCTKHLCSSCFAQFPPSAEALLHLPLFASSNCR